MSMQLREQLCTSSCPGILRSCWCERSRKGVGSGLAGSSDGRLALACMQYKLHAVHAKMPCACREARATACIVGQPVSQAAGSAQQVSVQVPYAAPAQALALALA